MTSEKHVLAATGMPGSGKSLLVEAAKENGYDVVSMGDAVREETRKRGLEPNPQNIGKVMLELRKTEGKSAVAKRCLSKIRDAKANKIVVDGVRSLDEVEEFQKHFPRLVLVAVHASPETRFRRLYRRARSDDSAGWEVFRERDIRELGVGIGGAIAMAEYMVVNEEPYNAAKARMREVLRKVEEKWTR